MVCRLAAALKSLRSICKGVQVGPLEVNGIFLVSGGTAVLVVIGIDYVANRMVMVNP